MKPSPLARPIAAAEPSAAQLAKAALRRLALAQQEPTPENYARAWAAETGNEAAAAPTSPVANAAHAANAAAAKHADPADDARRAWAALVQQLVTELQRPSRQWTLARRRDSLQRVFDGSRSDPQRLQQRLQGLLGAWTGDGQIDRAAAPAAPAALAAPTEITAALDEAPWLQLSRALHVTVQAALPTQEERAVALADRLSRLTARLPALDALTLAEIEDACDEAQSLLGQRHRLVHELRGLSAELANGLVDLADDDRQTRGLLDSLRSRLGESELPSVRALRAARVTFAETFRVQRGLREQRRTAHDALKQMIQRLLAEVGELDAHTDHFDATLQRHAEAVQQADTLQSLASVVSALVSDSQAVRGLVSATRSRLAGEHHKAHELSERVLALEAELRRVADEATTDALTQVSNRRGLQSAFDAELGRLQRAAEGAPPLALALIDIDNFKKLNDTLGHSVGDQALKSLAAAVRERLRPADHLSRFGGEEFVVLLPDTERDVAQQAITRLQRSLTEALFLHGEQEVFVTFSAGVTSWRPGETLEASLERADEALYEAKRTGKNRTCVA